MKPILYEKNEQKFSSNGIGRLTDAISCNVTEERNGIYELNMKYPINGQYFSELKHSRIIFAVPSDGADAQPFRIYKMTKPMNGITEIYAEHISYQLSHIPTSAFTADDVQAAFLGLKANASENCPFEFWTDKTTKGTFFVEKPTSIRSRLGGSRGSILDVYGGEFEFDTFLVKLHNHRGVDNGVNIKYGKNLTDLNQEENIQNTITGVYPYYKGTDGKIIELPEKTLYASNVENYPYNRTVTKDFTSEFEEEPSILQLREATINYMKSINAGIPSVSITVEFQPLWQTEEYKNIALLERVRLCDTVTVEFEELGVRATSKVNKTVYDVLLERYESIDLGDVRNSLSTTVIEQKTEIENKPTITFLEQAILSATEQITGVKGGYIVFRQDANKHPYEMLIMDKPDIQDAKNVWRFNQAGIGHSATGYNGPYSTAITQDGKIVADFITAGTLIASLIKAGTISDLKGQNYWNIETGEFVASNMKMLGGSIEIETNDIETGVIRFKAGTMRLEIRPSGLFVFLNTDRDSGTYYSISENGFCAGVASYGFGTIMLERVSIRKNDDSDKFEMQNSHYPSFSFKTADNRTVTVSGGCITEVN